MPSSPTPDDGGTRPPLLEELARMGFSPVGGADGPDAGAGPAGRPDADLPKGRPPSDEDAGGSGDDGAAGPRRASGLLDASGPLGGALAWQPTSEQPAAPTAPQVRARPGDRSELTADALVRQRPEPPARGWRRAVFRSTGGRVDPGPARRERQERELVARATRPVPGCWRIAVISLKGGVGKTTTTAALGSQLATLRGDRVVAVDANPDRGTLVEKVPHPARATVRDLLRDADRIRSYSDVRAYTSQTPSRLEVLASDSDPSVSQAFSEEDYRTALEVLERYYSLVLTDCGTGLLHSAMRGVLGVADALVVVASSNLDGARSASATLDWLEAHGHADLVRSSVAVVSSVRPSGGAVDVAQVERHFAERCRAVVRVPFDPHLEAGASVSLTRLRPRTRQAYLELAAVVGDGFPRTP